MDITYLGDFAFRLQNKKTSVILRPDVVEFVGDSQKVLQGPGEYEVGDVSVFGVLVGDGVFYSVEMDNIKIGYMNVGGKKLSEAQVSLVGDIDVLMLPVEEGSVEIVSEFEPKYVIPMDLGKDDIDEFVKKLGFRIEKVGKLVIKQDKEPLPSNDQVVAFLEKRS